MDGWSAFENAVNTAEQFVSTHINPNTLTGAIGYLLIFLVLAKVANAALQRTIGISLAHDVDHRLDPTALGFLRGLGRIAIWLAALVLYAHLIPSLRTVGTALLTGVSVISIIFGLAVQNTLGNLVAGIAILAYRPFRQGDRLQVLGPAGLETGVVETLSLGYTILRTYDNRRMVLPNSGIANQAIINLSSVELKVMAVVPISISYDSDIAHAKEVLLNLAHEHKDTVEPYSCPVVALGTSSVDLSLRMWCSDADAASRVKAELLEQAKNRLTAEGIEIPYAYTNVILHQAFQAKDASEIKLGATRSANDGA